MNKQQTQKAKVYRDIINLWGGIVEKGLQEIDHALMKLKEMETEVNNDKR